LEYFENNFAADQLKLYALSGYITGDLVQREHRNRGGVRSSKTYNISETVQDTTKITMTD